MATKLQEAAWAAFGPKERDEAAWRAEVKERAPVIVRNWWNRLGEGEEQLAAPGCKMGCTTCYSECASRRFAAVWWGRKLREIEQTEALTHNGVSYAEPMGRA